jgi:hypothetical protein
MRGVRVFVSPACVTFARARLFVLSRRANARRRVATHRRPCVKTISPLPEPANAKTPPRPPQPPCRRNHRRCKLHSALLASATSDLDHRHAQHLAFALPTRGTTVPSTSAFLHEIKHDGYRLMVRRDADRFGKSNTVLDLTPTALYELAAPSTPPEVWADRFPAMTGQTRTTGRPCVRAV